MAKRKYPIKPGDTLYHYTGLRNNKGKKAKKLLESICLSVDEIYIEMNTINFNIYINGKILYNNEALLLARADGFETFFEFMLFFYNNHKFPFTGDIIKW